MVKNNNNSRAILVVEDHPLYRGALTHLLNKRLPEFQVVAAHSGEEAIQALMANQEIEVILLDMGLPGLSGADLISEFRLLSKQVKIVVLSGSEERREIAALLKVGAQAFVSKGASTEALLQVLQKVICDELTESIWVGAAGNMSYMGEALPELTGRQTEILQYLCQGYSNKEIALRMSLAEVTIKLHVSSIFRILGVANRTQAVLAAGRLGLATKSS